MKLQLVAAGRGVQWARQGFQAFLRRPLAFAGLFGLSSLAILLVSVVPLIGAMVSFAAMPLMSLGFMVATQEVLQGRVPKASVFWSPLQSADVSRRNQLLKMCVGYALCITAMLLLWLWLDGGRLQAYRDSLGDASPTPEAMNAMAADGRLLVSLFTPALLVSLLSVPFWHAPALVHWGGLPAGKALFFSTVACWRNRGAFLLYGATWVGVLTAFILVSSLLFALLGIPQAAMLAAAPAALLLSTVFYASLFFTFVECFEQPATSTDLQEPMP